MKAYTKFILAAVLFCLMFLIESCSSSSLVDVWNDPSYHESPLKKIVFQARSYSNIILYFVPGCSTGYESSC
ncbi:MAG: hypothetical protein ABR980_14660 [Ignavibacteriaceae bacterium]